jgi:hypothetical protein
MEAPNLPKIDAAAIHRQLQHLSHVTDVHSTKIDPEIMTLVALLNLIGIPTCDSCAGHDDAKRLEMPEITLGDSLVKTDEHSAAKAAQLLALFYLEHSSYPERDRLNITHDYRGGVSLGVSLALDDPRRGQLSLYQQQMQEFAAWLGQRLGLEEAALESAGAADSGYEL